MNHAKWISFVLVVLFISGCALIRPGPAATCMSFYRHLENGEITEAQALVSARLVQQMGQKMRAGLEEESRNIKARGGISDIKIVSEEVHGELATVKMVVTFGNQSTKEDTSKLTLEDGRWRLAGGK